ncbi:MAG TPA: STAS domain-containing protein [Streptosporangiaceae bacterium]|nr:STAS domain-containing protein [Streptosporangiaceae bacterium]
MPQAEAGLVVTVRPDEGGLCLLSVAGELDYHTAPRLRAGLDEVPLDEGLALIIDLSGLSYCDSTGVSVLVGAYHRAKATGAALALAGMNSDIARVFRVIGLDQVFTSYDSVEAAARALAG